MAQLDKLLAAMMSNHASALVLTDGEVVKLEIGGQLRPLTKTPLTPAQILALLNQPNHIQEGLRAAVCGGSVRQSCRPPRGPTVDYFFFASSLSSLRASSIARPRSGR